CSRASSQHVFSSKSASTGVDPAAGRAERQDQYIEGGSARLQHWCGGLFSSMDNTVCAARFEAYPSCSRYFQAGGGRWEKRCVLARHFTIDPDGYLSTNDGERDQRIV